MISTARALYAFLSGFGIPAYTTDNVPDAAELPPDVAELPYLTYPLKEPEWNQKTTFYVTVYYRNQNSAYELLSKADEIVASIGEGKILDCDGGYVVLWPETPLVQPLPPDNDVRAAYINLSMNAYHMPGI